MLLAQKSKPVVLGRKRKRHALAAAPGQADERMQEEIKFDPSDHMPGAQNNAAIEAKRGKRNRLQFNPDSPAG